MGNMEKEVLVRRRKGYVKDAVLAAVGLSGLLLVSMAGPYPIQLFSKTSFGKRFKEQTLTTFSRFAKECFIKFEKHGGKRYARITGKGRKVLALEQQKK